MKPILICLLLAACGGDPPQYAESGSWSLTRTTRYNDCPEDIHPTINKTDVQIVFTEDDGLELGGRVIEKRYRDGDCNVVLMIRQDVWPAFYYEERVYLYYCRGVQFPDCTAIEDFVAIVECGG
jgi:hypothetical protein